MKLTHTPPPTHAATTDAANEHATVTPPTHAAITPRSMKRARHSHATNACRHHAAQPTYPPQCHAIDTHRRRLCSRRARKAKPQHQTQLLRWHPSQKPAKPSKNRQQVTARPKPNESPTNERTNRPASPKLPGTPPPTNGHHPTDKTDAHGPPPSSPRPPGRVQRRAALELKLRLIADPDQRSWPTMKRGSVVGPGPNQAPDPQRRA